MVGFYERCVEPCDLFGLRWEVNRLSCGISVVSGSSLRPTPIDTYPCISSSRVKVKVRTAEGSKRRYARVPATGRCCPRCETAGSPTSERHLPPPPLSFSSCLSADCLPASPLSSSFLSSSALASRSRLPLSSLVSWASSQAPS